MRKLFSRKGTLLGTVTMPEHFEYYLKREGGFRFAIHDPLRFRSYFSEESSREAVTVKTGVVHTVDHYEKGAVCLIGISPEEWEKIPGCTFHPGAAYLRSLLDEG